jgi:exopolyphosphatase/guanosine-5'-triphosphate,3'-diphosphate pyrophosphatase
LGVSIWYIFVPAQEINMQDNDSPKERAASSPSKPRLQNKRGPSNKAKASSASSASSALQKTRLYAAVDLGTNNCRLLIVERSGGLGFRVRDSFSRIVRLGEGLEASGELSEDAMARTIAALRIAASKIRRANVVRLRCVATEACRGASNGAAFIQRVRKETGLRMEIIDGQAEAELAAIGCGSLFDENVDDIILYDIGGGSTEISRMSRQNSTSPQNNDFFKLVDSDSVPLGVVRLSERHAGPGPHEHGYEGMLEESETRLKAFMDRQSDMTDMSRVQIIGTSGTVTTLAAVQLGLARYDRNVVDGCTITAENVTEVIGNLRQMSRDQLAENPCIGVQRADLVLSGCAVLEAIHTRWPVAKVSVADRGLREGLLLRMIKKDMRRSRRNRGRRRSHPSGAPNRDAPKGQNT